MATRSPLAAHRSPPCQVIVLPRLFFGASGRLKLLALCARTGRELVSTRRGNVALVERVAQACPEPGRRAPRLPSGQGRA